MDINSICGSRHSSGQICEYWNVSNGSCELIAQLSRENKSLIYDGGKVFHKFILARCDISSIITNFVQSRLADKSFSNEIKGEITTLFYEETIEYLENTFVKKKYDFSDPLTRNLIDIIKIIWGAWRGAKKRIIGDALYGTDFSNCNYKHLSLVDFSEQNIYIPSQNIEDSQLILDDTCSNTERMMDLRLADMWVSAQRADAIRRIIAVKKYSKHLLEHDIGKEEFTKEMGIDPAMLRRGINELKAFDNLPDDPNIESTSCHLTLNILQSKLPDMWNNAKQEDDIRQIIYLKKYVQALSEKPGLGQMAFAREMGIDPISLRKAIQLLKESDKLKSKEIMRSIIFKQSKKKLASV